jgi:hypothetical protein
VQDATALIEAHESHPFRNTAGRLLRMNYDTQKEPWRTLCIYGFQGQSEDLGAMFDAHGCGDDVVQVTSCESYAQSLFYPLIGYLVQTKKRGRHKPLFILSTAQIFKQQPKSNRRLRRL